MSSHFFKKKKQSGSIVVHTIVVIHTCDIQLTMLLLFCITAAVVGGEAAYTGLNTKPDTPGRPTVPTTLIGAGVTVVVRFLLCLWIVYSYFQRNIGPVSSF